MAAESESVLWAVRELLQSKSAVTVRDVVDLLNQPPTLETADTDDVRLALEAFVRGHMLEHAPLEGAIGYRLAPTIRLP
jgi:hypothetical protein